MPRLREGAGKVGDHAQRVREDHHVKRHTGDCLKRLPRVGGHGAPVLPLEHLNRSDLPGLSDPPSPRPSGHRSRALDADEPTAGANARRESSEIVARSAADLQHVVAGLDVVGDMASTEKDWTPGRIEKAGLPPVAMAHLLGVGGGRGHDKVLPVRAPSRGFAAILSCDDVGHGGSGICI